mmetsp:Transcript_27436/g.63255  ORF Transcript_27436/g.63255 Transcript_27436/m.63255 type:complete len:156 (-) Transcript_27436:424-891(-)
MRAIALEMRTPPAVPLLVFAEALPWVVSLEAAEIAGDELGRFAMVAVASTAATASPPTSTEILARTIVATVGLVLCGHGGGVFLVVVAALLVEDSVEDRLEELLLSAELGDKSVVPDEAVEKNGDGGAIFDEVAYAAAFCDEEFESANGVRQGFA